MRVALKKTVFNPKKKNPKQFSIFFTFLLCNFLVRTLQCKKKLRKKKFAHEKMKKRS
jgi:hypothetical protein